MHGYKIKQNEAGEFYITEKNYGHKPGSTTTSEYWTWHFTQRAINYLSRGHFGQTVKMPLYITHEQLEDLKAFNMLRRSDGTLIHSKVKEAEKYTKSGKRIIATGPTRTSSRSLSQSSSKSKATTTYKQPTVSAKPKRGLFGWLKSLFTKK